uniref:t-SNARE coiled-coil homology domain-containing protein n=1 Tax=Ditylenchus dipsaci TaxID=166011 RepID=A0A915ECH4_9BILA
MELEQGNTLIHQITSNIQQLNQNVQNLNVIVEKIGGPDDTDTTKNSMSTLVQNSNFLSKSTSSLIKKLVPLSSDNRQIRVQSERLMNEYMAVLNRLQAAQRKAAFKEKAQIKTVSVEDEILSSQGTYKVEDDQSRMQLQQQHRVNLNEIKERQQALSQLESDIGDVNQIFKDLAMIVHDQGEMVDSIEANVEHASIYVEQGHQHVSQALAIYCAGTEQVDKHDCLSDQEYNSSEEDSDEELCCGYCDCYERLRHCSKCQQVCYNGD